MMCTTAAEIRRAKVLGKTCALMGIELLKRGGDIPFVGIGERDLNLLIGLFAVHQLDERVDTPRHIQNFFAQGFHLLSLI